VIAFPRTLHSRLTFAYSVAFCAGLILFAAISYTSLDAALKTVVDARLRNAEVAFADILARDPEIDHATRERLELILGASLSGAVFSDDGRALYSSIPSIAPSTRAVVSRAGDLPRLTTLRIGGASGRLVTHRIVTRDGSHAYIGIWRQLDLVDELERLALIILSISVVVIGGSAVVVGSMVARQGLTPLRAVATLASEIEANDLSRRLGVQSDTSELGRLATTFDRMLARLEAAFERQRQFTADASHELRAPLSVIHIAAELALRREREPEAYRRVLASILRATQQLEDMTDRLLTAARADAGQTQAERVDVAALVAEAVDQMRPLAEPKRVVLAAQAPRAAFVDGDRSGISRAIVALLDNAIKFSPPGGSVVASVTEEQRWVRIVVQDEGPGFSAEGLARATDRFWRDDAARMPGSGSGLGLAISDSVVRASGGTLVLQNAGRRGALVVMAFPAAI
jgi:signal transduction histidine kinase